MVGVGATPGDELARGAELAVDTGILVDEFLTTSDPRILAAGDVANAWHPLLGARLRVEHWDNAIKQGLAAADNMLGTPTPFTGLPFFYSDQYEFGGEYRGQATTWDQVVFAGLRVRGGFLAFWLHQGRVLAAMNAGIWDQGDALDNLLKSGATPSPQRLADPTVDLADLVSSSGGHLIVSPRSRFAARVLAPFTSTVSGKARPSRCATWSSTLRHRHRRQACRAWRDSWGWNG